MVVLSAGAITIVVVAVLLLLILPYIFRRPRFPDFAGRHVVVTGASSGIGLALAKLLRTRGADLTLISQDPGRLHAAADAVRALPPPSSLRSPTVLAVPALLPLLPLSLLALLLAIFLAPHHRPTYVFTPDAMLSIARAALAGRNGSSLRDPAADAAAARETINNVVAALQSEYPRHIMKEPEWIFNKAGGAMGAMLVLHCSLSEYVIIFGTPIGTDGHTGRFLADDFFTILHGEQWAFSAGSTLREVYAPGDQHHLPKGLAKSYRMPHSCWALEYARGNIPSMMPFGLFDSFFSTLDFHAIWRTVVVSARAMFRELAQGKV